MKKPPVMTSEEFDDLFTGISKAALIDALWCASQIGTNDTLEEFATMAARNVEAALIARGERVPRAIETAAKRQLDGDPQ